MHVVTCVVDLSFYRRAHQWTAHDTVADCHLAGGAREIRSHLAEVDTGLPGYARGSRHHSLQRGLAAHREAPNKKGPDLRRLFLRRSIQGNPHLTTKHARIHVGKPEERTGVVGLQIDDVM